MGKQEDTLRQYIDSLDKRIEDLTIEEKTNRYLVEKDRGLTKIVNTINSLSSKEKRLNAVDTYEKEKNEKLNEAEKVKEVVSKTFGVSLDKIDFLKLESGIDIIAFYDDNLSRKRIIDYTNAKSIAEEFSKIQNEDKKFQSDDYEKNSIDIAKQEAEVNNGKRELSMMDVDSFKNNYNDIINNLDDPIKIQNIKKIYYEVENRKFNKIKYINLDNMIALDEKNNIVESYYDSKTNQSKIETPVSYKTSVNTIDNKENVEKNVYEETGNESSSIDAPSEESSNLEPTEFEKKEDIDFAKEIDLDNEMAICAIYKDREEVMNNIKRYTSNMDQLENDYAKGVENGGISQEEYEFYIRMTDQYAKVLENKMTKKLTLQNNMGSNGFANILFISILIMFLVFLLFII